MSPYFYTHFDTVLNKKFEVYIKNNNSPLNIIKIYCRITIQIYTAVYLHLLLFERYLAINYKYCLQFIQILFSLFYVVVAKGK